MRDFFEEFLIPVIVIGIVTALALGTTAGAVHAVSYFQEKDQCQRYEVLTGVKTYYSWSTPCYVQKDGRWITLDALTTNVHDLTVREGR